MDTTMPHRKGSRGRLWPPRNNERGSPDTLQNSGDLKLSRWKRSKPATKKTSPSGRLKDTATHSLQLPLVKQNVRAGGSGSQQPSAPGFCR